MVSPVTVQWGATRTRVGQVLRSTRRGDEVRRGLLECRFQLVAAGQTGLRGDAQLVQIVLPRQELARQAPMIGAQVEISAQCPVEAKRGGEHRDGEDRQSTAGGAEKIVGLRRPRPFDRIASSESHVQ
ncbi:MAG: hypothetical protein ACREXW_18465 [Gammaproteobacteria bacterium]